MFFDSYEMVHLEYSPLDQRITKEHYKKVLCRLSNAECRKR